MAPFLDGHECKLKEDAMIYSGNTIQVHKIESGIAHLVFDAHDDSVNKFSVHAAAELEAALDAVEECEDVEGLLLSSNKSVFIVGADVTEFGDVFAAGPDKIRSHLQKNNRNFNRIEDMSIPSVVAINGYALGGGLEICLACDFRLLSSDAKIGLPETKLGLLPGWGGTVRLARLAGLDTAIEWIAGGGEYSADDALRARVVDGVVQPEVLYQAALKTLRRLMEGQLPYVNGRKQKTMPLTINDTEAMLAFEGAKMFVGAKAGPHYPAPLAAIKAMQDGAKARREEAQSIEQNTFIELAQTTAAKNLVGLFLSDQYLIKKAKSLAKQVDQPVSRAAVLGAGIMGGGIAYQSASRGVPIKMKDIAQSGIDAGKKEAAQLLSKRVERGRITVEEMADALNLIEPTLSYDGFPEVDLVVEAVVENATVKRKVLAEVEKQLRNDAVLCSNTSTISIDLLASGLQRPENFCGMHFFNPVHAMPLVEVIKGEKTSATAVARVVSYALALGKKPVVVNDCPGFLVNRVLFPYFAGFSFLLRDGADFQRVDKVMERWGWPMGPAYLLDVVGMDTAVHAERVMAEGFPDRMQRSPDFKTATEVLYEAGRLGQKNQQGFYCYERDRKGKPVKKPDPRSADILSAHVTSTKEFSDEEIITRMMVPLATELARCLEEGVVSSPIEADMALLYGLGFPPFRGGVFRWLDEIGIATFIQMAERLGALGPLYQPTPGMRLLAQNDQTYYPA